MITERIKDCIYQEIDGFYVYEPKGAGFFTSCNLREIADLLDELNEPWQKEIEEYHKHLPS